MGSSGRSRAGILFGIGLGNAGWLGRATEPSICVGNSASESQSLVAVFIQHATIGPLHKTAPRLITEIVPVARKPADLL